MSKRKRESASLSKVSGKKHCSQHTSRYASTFARAIGTLRCLDMVLVEPLPKDWIIDLAEHNGFNDKENVTTHQKTHQRQDDPGSKASRSPLTTRPAPLATTLPHSKHESNTHISSRGRKTRTVATYANTELSDDGDGFDEDSDSIPISLDAAEGSSIDKIFAVTSSDEDTDSSDSNSDSGSSRLDRRKKQPADSDMDQRRPNDATTTQKRSKSRMVNLASGRAKALDSSLRPMSDIGDIFADMTKNALAKGLRNSLPTWTTRPFRVATMCSGTESPLLALEMIQKVLPTLGESRFNVVHLFSAEIVPYKQAYIERNFKVPIIFRDITELTKAKDSSHKATTAYGARVTVPGEVHLIIAGTACVDYSLLNNKQKSLHDNGESGDTFRAVLSYAKTWRPKMLILENVFSAPWNEMLELYEAEGYAVAGVLVDTKHYYLPQTRQRGYMLCLDKAACTSAKAAIGAAKQWAEMMGQLRRQASSPASDFMRPNDDQAVLRSRALLARKSLLDKPSREVDWSRCAIRHLNYRRQEQIGNARPYTSWQESGSMSVPDYADHEWFRNEAVERILDQLDCSYLRKALPKGGNFDMEYKARIINVSQNVDRNPDSTPAGICPCLTPSGIFFLTSRGGLLSPEETLALQGLPLDRISFTTETPRQIQDLAGNAMSSTVVGATILSAMIATASSLIFDDEHDDHRSELPTCKRPLSVDHPNHTRHKTVSNFSKDILLSEILNDAKASAQQCACEGPFDISRKPIQSCHDCSHTSCLACGGKPVHNYGNVHLDKSQRLDPKKFREKWEARLPSHLHFAQGPSNLYKGSCNTQGEPELAGYVNAAEAAFKGVFQFYTLCRGRDWAATWKSANAYLELEIRPTLLKWKLFAIIDPSLPVSHELRALLQSPVAVGQSSDTFFTGVEWSLRIPRKRAVNLKLTGSGGQSASWLARLNLPAHREDVVWNKLTIDCKKSSIAGEYEHLPSCGTASASLYKRKSNIKQKSRFLILDSDPIGESKDDCFIITDDPRRMKRRDRRIYVRFPSTWRPSITSAKSTVDATFESKWTKGFSGIVLQALQGNLDMTTLCTDNWTHAFLGHDCSTGVEIVNIRVPSQLAIGSLHSTGTISFSDVHWLFALLNPHIEFRKHTQLHLTTQQLTCRTCMPVAASLRWKRSADMKSLIPYEDPAAATRYEEDLKARPEVVQLSRPTPSTISISLNLIALAHRALGRLQSLLNSAAEPHDPDLSWKIDTAYHESSSLTMPVFSLRGNHNDQLERQPPSLEIELWPLQQQSLAWMLGQEAGTGIKYTIEEAEELLIPGADWRVEVTARTTKTSRGGILASHPGFGKTICTLALVATDFEDRTHEQIINSISSTTNEMSDRTMILAATLVIAPKHLVTQWTDEISKVLGEKFADSTITVATAGDLNKYDVNDFKRAKVIVLNQEVLTSDAYVKRLATFAGMPEPSTTKGRQYSTWLNIVNDKVREHLHVLQGEGKQGLQKRVLSEYKSHMQDKGFETVVPSKRRTGKAYTDWKQDSGIDSDVEIKASHVPVARKDLAFIDRCLFEMFIFNRIVVDEFTYLASKETVAIENLKGDKRWALSATAKLQDPCDIAYMAGLIGVTLRVGENAPGAVSQRNLKRIVEERTSFEQFQMFRSAPSMAVTERTFELAQNFLDLFVRQNILRFEDHPYLDQLVPVHLSTTHRLVYTELSQHLNAADMRLTKSRKSGAEERDREFQIHEVLKDVSSAEEALSRLAALYLDVSGAGQTTVDALAAKRTLQASRARDILSGAIEEIVRFAHHSNSSEFASWKEEVFVANSLGDDDCTKTIRNLFTEAEKTASSIKPARKPSTKTQQMIKEKLVVLTTLAKQYTTMIRSVRFINNAKMVTSVNTSKRACNGLECSACSPTASSISSLCGHTICDACWTLSQTRGGLCTAVGCKAALFRYHLLSSGKLRKAQPDSTVDGVPGAKARAILELLQKISEVQDQAILFVQYEAQIDRIAQACRENGIGCIAVSETSKANILIQKFQDERDPKERSTVIILNASKSTAAGSNLTNANHVLFMSPMLADSQYNYDAALAQAIGRVRRPGQTKDIFVYRFTALDTIDVDILEHRERRTTALSEVGAPALESTMKQSNEELVPERTQLIQDTKGHFRLLPKSWLIKGSKGIGSGVQGRYRVEGYEDHSSLVKFSKAYSEDD